MAKLKQKYDIPDTELDGLLLELQKILSFVEQKRPTGQSDTATVILRLLDGVSQKDWEAISKLHGLEGWIAMPLYESTAKAIESLRERIEDLVFQSDHDALTTLPNRRFFDRQIAMEVERTKRTNSALSLLMIDLDNFKNINDSYGHPCGDKVLKILGNVIVRSMRPYDFPARIGGEEFVVILPGTDTNRAVKQAERLLENFRKEVFHCDTGSPFSMTFSVGVAGMDEDTGYICAEDLLQSSDTALYRAKNQGKNRVVSAEQSVVSPIESMVRCDEKRFLFAQLFEQYNDEDEE